MGLAAMLQINFENLSFFMGIALMSQTSLQLSSSKLKTDLAKPCTDYIYTTSVPPPPSLVLSITSRSFVEAVIMNSWLVTVLLLASAANSSGGQDAVVRRGGRSVPVVLCPFSPTGAQVPITSYTCTQPNLAVFLDHG